MVLAAILEGNGGTCLRCHNPNRPSYGSSPDPEEGYWELTPENASPLAKTLLLDDFFWNSSDDHSPMGNDTGADTLAFYQGWRGANPQTPATSFLRDLLMRWEVSDRGWTESSVSAGDLVDRHFEILTRDDMIIALAFSQIVVDGKLDRDIKIRSLLAVTRQALPTVLAFRGWDSQATRIACLEKMRTAIEAA